MSRWSLGLVLALAVACGTAAATAAPVAVRFPEGATHAFPTVRSERGEILAHGELVQVPRANGVESHLVFHFKDGSLYDETVTFSQQKVFRLLAYRLVQRGKSFPGASEVAFDRASGRYRARTGGPDDAAVEGTLDLPDDVHNGMTGLLLKNLPSGVSAAGHLVAFTPKPRLLKSDLRPEAADKFFVGDLARTATRYLVKLEIGGLAGVAAHVLGKDPPDLRYWISTGPAPAFIKFEGAMFLKGPRWRIELGAPRWAAER
jgi:hypothetical protein